MQLVVLWVLLAAGSFLCGQETPRTGTLEWQGRLLTYEVRNGFAVVEGDILLGTADEIDRYALQQRTSSKSQGHRESIVVAFGGSQQRWPEGTMYYTIDPDLPNPQRIESAIAHWNERTRLKVLPRTSEPNYIRFRRAVGIDAACSSFLGMRGGSQLMETGDGCTTGNAIHEIGHAFGLLHEQQRADSHANVTVLFQNIDKRFVNNFETGGGVDAAFYDYGSIMHYPASGFTRDGLTSLETVPIGIPIGQRATLSVGDIAAIETIYGFPLEATVITSVPEGIPLSVDGVEGVTPFRVNWAPGSQHRLAAPYQSGTDPLYVWAKWSNGGPIEQTVTAQESPSVYSAAYQLRRRVSLGVTSGDGSASISPPSADGYYPQRTLLRLKAQPAGGNIFQRWTGTTNFNANGQSLFSSETTLEVTTANLNYQANFVSAITHTIETVPAGRTIIVDGTGYISPVKMIWTPGSTHTLILTNAQSAGNNTVRHEFRDWEDGSTSPVRSITAGEPGAVYRANFVTKYLLSLATIGAGTLRAEPQTGDNFYEAGSTVQLTATPGAGLTLRYWLGDLAGATPSVPVVIDEQKVITAYFAAPIAFRILHSATYIANPRWNATGTVVAPGEIVTIFGENIGPSEAQSARVEDGKLVASLGGVSLTFDNLPAPLVFVSQNQVSAIVPYGITAAPVARFSKDGASLGSLSFSAAPAVPGFYTANSSGKGIVAALNQDGTVHSTQNPVARGSVIVLYATGAGLLNETIPDGQVTGSKLVTPRAPVYVKIGKQNATVLYAGTAPGLVNGVLQVNVLIPEDVLPGDSIPIQLAVGAASSPPGATIAVR